MWGRQRGGLFLATGLACCSGVHAAGFAISEKSVSGLGRAFAGEAAVVEDASTVYHNPAGMMQLEGHRFTAALHPIHSEAEFSNQGSTTVGSGSNEAVVDAYVPNVYFVRVLGPDLRAGLGINSPFGLGLAYDDDWIGRYHTISTDLRTLNLSPAIAYRLGALSLGASVDIQKIEAEMSQAVDFGTLCVAQQMAGGASQSVALASCNAIGLQPQQDDGVQQLKGDDWSTGYTLGVTVPLSAATRLGAVYHSGVRQNLTGSSSFQNVPTVFATAFTNSDASMRLNLPPMASLSLAHELSSRLHLFADYTWTGWSSHEELRVKFANALSDSVTEEDWRDAARYAVGMYYQWDPVWRLRAGFSYDETPVPDAAHRSPRLPDADRRSYAVGASWLPQPGFEVDLAFTYVAAAAIPIDNTDAYGHRLAGTYDVSGSFLSVQGNWNF